MSGSLETSRHVSGSSAFSIFLCINKSSRVGLPSDREAPRLEQGSGAVSFRHVLGYLGYALDPHLRVFNNHGREECCSGSLLVEVFKALANSRSVWKSSLKRVSVKNNSNRRHSRRRRPQAHAECGPGTREEGACRVLEMPGLTLSAVRAGTAARTGLQVHSDSSHSLTDYDLPTIHQTVSRSTVIPWSQHVKDYASPEFVVLVPSSRLRGVQQQ